MTPKPTISTVDELKRIKPTPCKDALDWLDKNNIADLADAWDQCHRADWMLWTCNVLDLLSPSERRMIACKCVRETPIGDGRTVWDLLADDRSRHAVTVAERYAAGEATDEELSTAYAAAKAAGADAAEAAAVHAAAAAKAAAAATVEAVMWAAEAAAAAAAGAAAYAARMDMARVASSGAAADAAEAAMWAAEAASYVAATDAAYVYAVRMDMVRGAQADLIREVAGNPFRDSRCSAGCAPK